jgi:hypothetical protein
MKKYAIRSAPSSFNPYKPETVYIVYDTTSGEVVSKKKSLRAARQFVKCIRVERQFVSGKRLVKRLVKRK